MLQHGAWRIAIRLGMADCYTIGAADLDSNLKISSENFVTSLHCFRLENEVVVQLNSESAVTLFSSNAC